jgi:hypothetical protein
MHPLAHIIEGVSVSDIIHYDYAMCPAIVAASQSAESFLSSCVPL